MNVERRLAFERARRPVGVAMRAVAAALAAFNPASTPRKSVFSGPRNVRRVAPRDAALVQAVAAPRGCEDLH